MSAVIVRTMPAGFRNGLTVRAGNYRYQGTGEDVLTAWMDEGDPRRGPLCGLLMARGEVCARRAEHGDHCKSRQAMETDRAKAAERTRKSRQRRAA